MLKLTAFDADDLSVISAQMQDAVIRAGDIKFLPRAKKLVMLANRFAWDEIEGLDGGLRRHRSGLQFARISRVRAHRIKQDNPDAVLSLLAITFEAGEEPSGKIRLEFSGGGTLEAEAECIEAALEDIGPAWDARHMPNHEEA